MYDFVIVGGGIAGLAVGELLVRSGRSVALLEAQERLCSVASARHHSWFHVGALYAALPSNSFFKTLVGNIDDLLDYYTGFDNMNLAVNRSLSTSRANGWFTNTNHFYAYVSPWAPELPAYLRLPWWLATKRAQRRLAWFENLDFHRVLSDQVRWVEHKVSLDVVKRSGSLGLDLGRIGIVLKSRDRTMDSQLIVKDLAASFLSAGGELQLGVRAGKLRRQEVETSHGTLRARHVIVTAGSGCAGLSGIASRVVYSPLLVVYPAVTSLNFVRMTPVFNQTINHLYHRSNGLEYSVFGSALYYPDESEATYESALAELRGRVLSIFPEVAENHSVALYFGPKSELVGRSQLRNYQYHILDTKDATVVLPGKFSLLFSTAVNACRHFGVEPLRQTSGSFRDFEYLDSIVGPPRHFFEANRMADASARRSLTYA